MTVQLRKRTGMWGLAVFFMALLPSLVAGQPCTGSIGNYVELSAMTALDGLAGDVATFSGWVRLVTSSSTLLLYSYSNLLYYTSLPQLVCIYTVLSTVLLVFLASFPTASFLTLLFCPSFLFTFCFFFPSFHINGNGPFLPAAIHRMLCACARPRSRGFACTMPTHVCVSVCVVRSNIMIFILLGE